MFWQPCAEGLSPTILKAEKAIGDKAAVKLTIFRIFSIELKLACSQGSCRAIFSQANIFNDFPPHEPPLQLVPVQHREYTLMIIYGLL